MLKEGDPRERGSWTRPIPDGSNAAATPDPKGSFTSPRRELPLTQSFSIDGFGNYVEKRPILRCS